MMLIDNHLFELLNAGSAPDALVLAVARTLAQWAIYIMPAGGLLLWLGGDRRARSDLVYVLLSALIALGLAQAVGAIWPLPRPFMVGLGHQYLAHAVGPGLPSDHVTVIWSVALGVLPSRRFTWLVFPLLTLGLAVGWSCVYLGVHFPVDVLAALPVAAAGAAMAWSIRRWLARPLARVARRYHSQDVVLVDRNRS